MSEEDGYEEQYQEVEPLSPEEAAAKSEELQQLEQAIGPEPRPADFTNYDEYVKSISDWQVKKHNYEYRARVIQDNPHADIGIVTAEAVRQGMETWTQQQALAQAQAQKQLAPFPDDPYRAKRAELERLSMEFGKEAIKQKERGNLHDPVTGFFAQRERQAQYENELAKLPPKPEQQFAEDMIDQVDFISVNALFNKEHANDKVWDHPRMQSDAGVVVARANSRNRGGVIALPMEATPFGNVLPVHPKNMCQLQLPKDAFETFKTMVYHSGGENTPEEVFRRSWRALHQLGYAGTAKPAIEGKSKKAAAGEETDPDRMTWAEFCKWREAQEDKKRGRPRQGFVHPKTRQRNG